jgi:hypothetical protein
VVDSEPSARGRTFGPACALANVHMPVYAITLTVPAERRFLGVVNLVLGGLGSRLDLPYTQVDDLQLAVDSALAHGDPTAEGELTVDVEVAEGRLIVQVGPLVEGGASNDGLKRVLAPLVASAWPLDREGREWIQLEIERETAVESR